MALTLARRIFLAHLELSYRLGRKVTLAEFGRLVAKQLGRNAPFSAAAVSRWEAGTQIPSADVIEAIADVTHTDPGWISHGERSAAPAPDLARGGAPLSALESTGRDSNPRGDGPPSANPIERVKPRRRAE
jgi:transcriptional regulator with XRE-family HTH domain